MDVKNFVFFSSFAVAAILMMASLSFYFMQWHTTTSPSLPELQTTPLVFDSPVVTPARILVGSTDVVQFRIPFRNTSSDKVKIIDAQACCGCGVEELKRKEIAAGEAGELKGSVQIPANQKSENIRPVVQVQVEHLGKRKVMDVIIEVLARRAMECDTECVEKDWSATSSYFVNVIQTRLPGAEFAEPLPRTQDEGLRARFIGDWQPMNDKDDFARRRRQVEITAPNGPMSGSVLLVDPAMKHDGYCAVRMILKETLPFKTSVEYVVLSEKNKF